MPVVMSMHWPEASLEQYERVRSQVKWETDVPEGALLHVAFMADDGFRVIDLWESPGAFQRFSDTRLTPVVQQVGIQGQPNVTFSPVHAIFNPNVPATSRTPRARRAPARRASAKRASARRVRPARGRTTASRSRSAGRRKAKR